MKHGTFAPGIRFFRKLARSTRKDTAHTTVPLPGPYDGRGSFYTVLNSRHYAQIRLSV